VHVRNRFRFRLGPRWALLEPGDLVSFSHAKLGISGKLCRIKSFDSRERGLREVTIEEVPMGAAQPVALAVAPHDGFNATTTPTAYVDTRIASTPGAVTADLIAPEAVSDDALAPSLWVKTSYMARGTVVRDHLVPSGAPIVSIVNSHNIVSVARVLEAVTGTYMLEVEFENMPTLYSVEAQSSPIYTSGSAAHQYRLLITRYEASATGRRLFAFVNTAGTIVDPHVVPEGEWSLLVVTR
jgi:hypothetical protein